jgi:8-oxo-dGTP pyrophosphatase MutT (NUDIX family)
MIANRIQHCTNCGGNGHVFRNCSAPVTSYGIIAMRYLDDTCESVLFSKSTIAPTADSIQFLLIQRKDSLSFIEFIRGKYGAQNDAYMCKLLRGMTQKEQHRLLTATFDDLWNDIWGKSPSARSHRNDYDASEKRFQQIREKLPDLIRDHPTVWTEPEWGFPKGRRNPYEMDINCAVREFQEETGLERNDFSVLQNTYTLSETFYGSNNVHYCHKYYLAICNKSVEVELDTNDIHMSREIGAIKWCTFEDAISKIRSDNNEKRDVLQKVYGIMKQYHPISTYDLFRTKHSK